MKRIGFLLKVKQELIEEYKEHHRKVWPEMLEALSKAGWHNYSLFLHEDGLLFGYFETPVSLQDAVAQMEKTEVNARWQAMMSPYFELPPGARPDQMLVELENVFYLD
ncbi:MAG: L-rhamnose mutarotase [Chloroflexi bacterium]|nr:L-rhamnose mutarotase [Chloroflexota bacterium]